MDYDFISACIDEIALEGLDGITIPSLWLRLEKRPKFAICIDEASKHFLWNRIALRRDIEFYELCEERKPLVLFDRYENVDLDVGIVTEPANLTEDIYPISIINESDVRGSCDTFHTRKNVTQEIREESTKLKLTLDEIMEKWNEKLVLVADQNNRRIALLGRYCDPSMELTDMQYVLLERIGRSRYHGEVTQGKMSLAVFKESPKSLHYQRKLLVAAKLVTKQIHYQRSCNGVMVCGSLFHLTRFYVEKKSKFLILLQLICKVLSERPNKSAPIDYLREALGLKEQSWKKILNKHLYQITRVIQIPLQEVKPNLPLEKYFLANGTPKTVRALQLLENIDVNKIGKEDDEDDEDEEDKTEIKELVKPWIPFLDRPFLNQTIEHLEQIGSDGASVRELSRSMNIPYLDSRMLMRNVARLKAVVPICKDVGKQKCTRFVPKKHIMQSELRQQICDEGLKMIKLNEKPVDEEVNSCKNLIEAKEGTSTDGNGRETPDYETDDTKSCGKQDKEMLIDVIKKMERPEFNFDNADVTYRKLKRLNIILQTVRQEKLINNTAFFRNAILAEETKEGVKSTIDRHTVRRLVKVLSEQRAINVFNTNLTCGEKLVKLQFICDKDVTEHSPIFKSAIEQAKVKKFFAPIPKKCKKMGKPKKNLDEEKKSDEILSKSTGKTTSTEVKFTRLRLLHEFLFYLIYEFEGKDYNDSSPLWEYKNDDTDISVHKIYKEENSFKRFIPPLPVYADWPKGWCLMSDAILRLPLRLFLKLINCPYKTAEMEPYLNDPIKQHYLVCHLEPDVRSVLFSGRRYIFSFSQNAELLARIGLLSFGPQQYKEKEQRFMYLHRTVAVIDTRLSEPSYSQITSDKEYKKLIFQLDSISDLDNFWHRTQEICLQTPLGCRTSLQTENVIVERVDSKAVMIAACASKNIDEIRDDGTIPGDGRGAGGFDTILYSHLQRNWFNLNKTSGKRLTKNEIDIVTDIETEKLVTAGCFYKYYLQQTGNENLRTSKRLSRLQDRNLSLKTKDKQLEIKVTLMTAQSRVERVRRQKRKRDDKSDTKKGKKLRKTIQKPMRTIRNKARIPKRRPYYDEKDKEALKRQPKKRVDWNATEDSFLLLCKVTSVLIAPNHYSQLVVASPFIRDLMLEHIPSSDDKTSRACQRRVMYMMRNPRTKYNVAVYVGEAQQDEDLMANVVHPNVPKTDEVSWENAFKKVLLLVLAKFKSTKKNYSSLQLPDSIEEFKNQFTLTSTDSLLSKKLLELEANNGVSLRFAVVYTLIMSAISSAVHKDKWAVHLYHLYSDYPDTLLRSVIIRLRNDQVIASKKSSSSRALRHRAQLSALPFQIHIAFENKLRTKYKPAVFEGARKFYFELTERHENGESYQITLAKGGFAAGLITLLAVDRIMLKIDDFDHLIQFEKDPLVDPPKKRQKCDEYFDSAKGTPSLTRKASRVHLYMKRQQIIDSPADSIQHSQDFLIVTPARVEITLKSSALVELESNEGCSSRKMMVPTVDHDYLTDSKCAESDLLICAPSSLVVDKILNSQLKLVTMKIFDDVWKQHFLYEQEEYFDFSNIYQFISAAKELGVTLSSIKDKFSKCTENNIKRYLDLMLSNGLVLRAGVNIVKYISMTNANMWILPKSTKQNRVEKLDKSTMSKRRKSCENDDGDLSNKFVPRPWKMPDGSLNVDMFDMMLRAVLCCIMVNPGIEFRDLVDQLLPTLQAVYALELIEILEEIKCITMIYMAKKKLTLFSTLNDCQKLDKTVGDPFKDKLSLDPNIECMLMLENFIEKL
uniref:Uncharacterized protein n=1 Tax=Strigamia maritima TaxID=126957 RepID=T1JE27_STRMM